MAKSVESEIDRAILNHKRGKILFPSNFQEFGSSTAVRKALDRLKDKGRLVRIAHGIYLYPKQDKLLGILYPTIEEIALAISKRDKSRIIPTGVNALNKLGLSSQVPMNVVYLTDGTPRVVKVYNRTIKFKIASPKLLSAKNTANILVIQALREIKKDKVDQKILDKILDILKNVSAEDIKHDMKLAPAWIREIMEKAVNESK
jgi:predicted transcriptional regulator of viral defense system